MKTVIIYGPPACGKTLHAASIAALFNMPADRVFDCGKLDYGRLPPNMLPGYIYLVTDHFPPKDVGCADIIKHYSELGLPNMKKPGQQPQTEEQTLAYIRGQGGVTG